MLLEREALLTILAEAAQAAAAGRGTTVLVSGEAGIGKTSLVQAFTQQASGAHRILRGACDALFTPRPLGPLRDIASSLDGRLAELMDGGAPPTSIFPAFLEELVVGGRPVVVVIEDLHWADHASFDLIRYLGRRIDHLRVLLILTYRDDEVDAEHPLRRILGDLPTAVVKRIGLPPLSAQAVSKMARDAGLPARGLFEATAGNPFFVTETLASASVGVPVTVREAVLARISRLAEPSRALLDLASVVPGRIDTQVVHATLQERAQAALDDCIERGVLLAVEGGVMFRHELARLAVQDTLSRARRRECHAAVLAAMSAAAALTGSAGAPAARLVYHAAESGNSPRVLELACVAATTAAQLGAHHQAAAHYATGLRFADQASPAQRAQLYEGWSYEESICGRIDTAVIDARHHAIELRRQLADAEGEGRNLRWLSRLHWYLGNRAEAERYIDEAVHVLETQPVGAELAMAYSVRSQLFMLTDETADAVHWGERAIALAERLGQIETRIHALNNVGSALLFSADERGRDKLEESLRLALDGSFHEHAARCYANLSEHAVIFKDFARAERYLAEGIAFDRAHDLDSWTPYLVGWQAQLRFDQGRFDEAQQICTEVLANPRLTAVTRLPALTVLGRVQTRRGQPGSALLLEQAMALARPTGEPQRIVPVALGLIEAAWLAGDLSGCIATLDRIEPLAGVAANPWVVGELAAWRTLCGAPRPPTGPPALPYQLEFVGRYTEAAACWAALDCPYQQALALLQTNQGESVGEALRILSVIDAQPAAARARNVARTLGVRGLRRGPYTHARRHPLGLTRREMEVLALLGEGLSNGEIAQRLSRSAHTVEHHVSALLAKLNVKSRLEAVALARREHLLPAQS